MLRYRGWALIIAIAVTAFMLLPAKVVLPVAGAAVIGLGIFYGAENPPQLLAAVFGGALLIAFGIRAVVLEHRQEAEEARKAAESVRRPRRGPLE